MQNSRVIILNGAMGVGKTTTARCLVDRLAPALMIDADHVADFRPFDVREPAHLAYVEDTVCHLLAFHAKHGFHCFVVAWVFETQERLDDLVERLSGAGHEVHCYRLKCSPAEHERRVRERNRTNLHWELERHRELARGLEIEAARGDMGQTIDVTGLTPEEVADIVAEQLGL